MTTDNQSAGPVAEPYLANGSPAVSWTAAIAELQRASTFWIATIHPASRPHVVPVLAVINDGVLHFAASPHTQKVHNLARRPEVAATTHGEHLDLVIEGAASRVHDATTLRSVASAYADKHGWQVDVNQGALHGEGAPTAGPSPYHVYRVVPRRAFGFPTDGAATPTRWLFPQHGSPD